MKNKNETPSAHPAGPDELIHRAEDGDPMDFDIDVQPSITEPNANEDYEMEMEVDEAFDDVILPEKSEEEGMLPETSDGDIAKGKWAIPKGKDKEQKMHRKLLAGALSHGAEQECGRFIDDSNSGERACVSVVNITPELRSAVETFVANQRALIANRTKPLPDGKYLFSRNGGPIYVYGGDDAENIGSGELKNRFREANDLQQIQ